MPDSAKKQDPAEFRCGDVVRQTGRDRLMTVERADGGLVWAVWFNQNDELQCNVFRADRLVKRGADE